VGPCHHSMTCPRNADGGDGLQIWKVPAILSNKQSQTADKEWSSSLYIGRGTDNSSYLKKKYIVTKYYIRNDSNK